MGDVCLSCGNGELLRVRPYRTTSKPGRELFGRHWLHECGQCRLVQLAPRPSQERLASYYAVGYRSGGFAGGDVSNPATFPKDNLFFYNRGQSVAELLSAHVRNEAPHILDIGAGYGHVLHALAERYPHASRAAIEFTDACVRHLRSIGIEVHTAPAEEMVPRLNRQFDLIVMSHVFEHFLEPRRMLDLLREYLSPGGLLYIEVPNVPAESLRRYPDHVWAPRFDEPHITLFSVPTLRHILESADLEVRYCDTAGAEYKYVSGLQFHLPHWRSISRAQATPRHRRSACSSARATPTIPMSCYGATC